LPIAPVIGERRYPRGGCVHILRLLCQVIVALIVAIEGGLRRGQT